MRFLSLATDYDGTLAHEGRVSATTLAALEKLRDSGRKIILVTGRDLDDLLQVFPEYAIFEKIVAENGAIIYTPSSRDVKLLAEPPPPDFVAALRSRGVESLTVGRSIVATVEPYGAVAQELIRNFGLELQLIYNKGSVMILPSGINKSTGLLAALSDLGLSTHNVVAVGDAENDHALLNICECQVAVANAIPTLKDRADFTTRLPEGAGVEELIDRMLLDDLQGVPTRPERSRIPLGVAADGSEITVSGYASNLLIAGPSESGKTTVLRSIVDRLIERGYQVCLIDPEGDHDESDALISLGTHDSAPVIDEIWQILQKPDTSVGVNLLGIPLADRPAFFASLLSKLHDLRAAKGRPHWIVLDEAHHMLPADSHRTAATAWESLMGLIFITVQVDAVLPEVLKTITGAIAVGPSPQSTLQQFGNSIGVSPPMEAPLIHKRGDVFVWMPGERTGIVSVHIEPSLQEARRHKRKYAVGRLSDDECFYFKGPKDELNLRAQNLTVFLQMAEGVDDATWVHHLRNGDYSAWIRRAIKDDALASEIMDIERSSETSASKSRSAIMDAIKSRYTAAVSQQA
jgi:hydroxymethylpyrimidine pyrophosphatase-like HAD family hydrolase